jgi:pimeloyl-ACP methyl ester carboxylesterase
MSVHTHRTAPTRYVEANGTRFAYRRFGRNSGQNTGPDSGKTVPLVFNTHLNGTMDHWDPAVTDGIAQDREVILFDNAGISSTSGEVLTSVEEMAANAAAFIKALGLAEVDVLGFSLGPHRPRAGDRRADTGAPSRAGRNRPEEWRGHGFADAGSAACVRRQV